MADREIDHRAACWKDSASLGWRLDFYDIDLTGKSMDDMSSFDDAATCLDEGFQQYAPTRDKFSDNIASWCGGWAQLLYARKTRAAEPPFINYHVAP